jgi:hypothetical protein
MKPGDLLVLRHSETLFSSLTMRFDELPQERLLFESGDVFVYLETFINPKVPKDRPSPDISNVDEGEGHLYCHVLKVLTRRGVLWVNDNGCVKPIDA